MLSRPEQPFFFWLCSSLYVTHSSRFHAIMLEWSNYSGTSLVSRLQLSSRRSCTPLLPADRRRSWQQTHSVAASLACGTHMLPAESWPQPGIPQEVLLFPDHAVNRWHNIGFFVLCAWFIINLVIIPTGFFSKKYHVEFLNHHPNSLMSW